MLEALDPQFSILLLSNGVLIGLMYSLIALGFVLVYKDTDAVNFAQGEFVMLAGFLLERVMLRKLIGRPVIAVVMATIGLAAILRGVGPFGIFQGTRPLPLPLR